MIGSARTEKGEAMTDYIKKADAYRIAVHGTDPDVAYKIQQLKSDLHTESMIDGSLRKQIDKVIEFAERRLEEEDRENNGALCRYWSAYLDGAYAVKRKVEEEWGN